MKKLFILIILLTLPINGFCDGSTLYGEVVVDNSGTFDTPTINTGNGDVECYAMNQDVESTDSVTFDSITATSTLKLPIDTTDTTEGNIRYSTGDDRPQYYDGTDWKAMGASYENTVTVSPSGGDYTTIQAALTANATEKTLFLIYPGTYTNDTINFTANNQHIRGIGRPNTTIITNASQVVETGDYTNCAISELNIQFNPTTAINGIEVNDGSLTIQSCKLTLTTSTNIVSAEQPALLATTGTGTLRTKLGEQYYYHTGACGGSAIKAMISVASGGKIRILRPCIMHMVNSGSALASTLFVDSGTGEVNLENACDIKVEDDTATIVAGLGYIGGSGDNMATHSSLTIIGGGANACYGLYNSGTGTFRSSHNNISVTGGATNYVAFTGVNATTIGHMDDVIAADGNSGTGTVKIVSSLVDGELTVTDKLSVAGTLTLPIDTTDTTEANIRYSSPDDEPQYYDGSNWHYLGSPKQLIASDTSVAEGNNSFSVSADKYLIKYLFFDTTSTDYTVTLYTDDGYSTGGIEIVTNRDGDYMVYLDLPYYDDDDTGEIHYNFTSASGSETHNITFYGVQMK